MPKGYALVLGGGGAKGAYHIGVWKALRENNIRIEAIFGTSVGAINACLIGQGDYFQAEQLWANLTITDILDLPSEILQDGRVMITPKTLPLVREFLKKTVQNGGLNTQPLKQLIDRYLNEAQLRKSGLDIGLVSLQLDTLSPLKAFLHETPPGSWANYILASAAFPGFKSPKIGKSSFVDGGLYNNIPHELARQRGYRRIIVVDNSGIGNNRPPDIAGTQTIYIKNTMNFGGEFDFVPEILRKWLKLGYYDALHVLGQIDGQIFFYKKNPSALHKLERLFTNRLFLQEIEKLFQREKIPFSANEWQQEIRKHLPDRYALLPSLAEALMEYAAFSFDIPRLFLYEWNDWVITIKKHLFQWNGKKSAGSLLRNVLEKKNTTLALDVLKTLFLVQDGLIS